MKDFIVNYGQYILYGIILILDLIILLFRKNKTVLTDKGVITDLLYLVIEAEDKFKEGKDKMAYVVSKYKEMHPEIFKDMVASTKSEEKASKIISDTVEYILSSPQKKGK